MRVVIDTNVLVAARRSNLGASNALLRVWLAGGVEAVVTVALFFEYEEVLKRPEHLLGGDAGDVDELLDALSLVSTDVESKFSWRPQLRDPDDDMVLDAAMNGGARGIVTFNRADFLPQAVNLGLQVLSPAQLLRRLI